MRVARQLIFASLLLVPLHAFAQSGGATGPVNPGVLNDSLNNNPAARSSVTPSSPSPNAVTAPPPGTNSAGTAQSSGGSTTVGMGSSRTDDAIRAEDPKIDKKIKSICKGC